MARTDAAWDFLERRRLPVLAVVGLTLSALGLVGCVGTNTRKTPAP